MMPEFTVQAMKLQANSRQPRPIKYVPPKPKSPSTKRSSSKQKSQPKQKPSTERLPRKISAQDEPTELIQTITEPIQPKILMNMDERYLYYEEEAKKKENAINLCDGVQFYKPIKPEEMPKPPRPARKQGSKIEPNKTISKTEKSEKQSEKHSVVSDLQHSLHQSQHQSSTTLIDENHSENQQIIVDPNFLIQGEVGGYQIEDSENQSQMFGFGLTDYIKNNNHKQDLGEKDVLDEVKPQHEQVYSYYDYYPKNSDGTIPKPLLESVNYMNYLKEQQAIKEQEQQNQQEVIKTK